MRGHSLRLFLSLRIHFISCSVLLCLLVRFALRLAPRAAWRGVMSPFSPCVPLLVPCGVPLIHRFPLRLPVSASCLLPIGSPSSWLSRIASHPALSSPRPSPRRSCRETGRHRLACRRHTVRRRELVRAASLPFWRGASLLAWLGAVLAYLNAFPDNLLKTCLGNLLKTCLGNSLNTAKHVSLPICPPCLSAVASLPASPSAVLSFSLVCDLS